MHEAVICYEGMALEPDMWFCTKSDICTGMGVYMKEERKRKILTAGIIILLALLLALCGTLLYDSMRNKKTSKSVTEEEQVEISLVYAYQNPQWNSAIEAAVRNFEELYPNIKVNYEVNYEDKVYEDILIRKIARDELGDIVQLKTPEAFAHSDTLGEISEEVADLVKYHYQSDGKIYGVGAVESTSGIIYNKEIFERCHLQIPQTYQEFLDVCKVLKKRGIIPIGVGGSDLWHMEYWVNHFFRTDVLSQNENWLQDCSAGTVSWTDASSIKMLTDLKGLFDAGYVNADWQTTGDGNLPYKMAEGEIAMMYTGPWTSFAIYKLNADMDLGWFYVPDENGTTYAGDNLDTFWSVTKECEEDAQRYEAAMTFLKYFYSEENYSLVCESICGFPLTKEDYTTINAAFQKETEQAFENCTQKVATYIGNEDTPVDFEKGMLSLLRRELSGELAIEDTAGQLQQLWESCIRNQEENQ